ncbi:uncharacterized protein LOC103307718 [Acyrthosiphon pisum]|uniref:HTH CENPB-type domain-containing protein n=1 Tax=Acyrthosiphon pisum TaxID=7029 RepID=A0A8R2AYK4_ACYPI|nr:uncharacterized protein LOC103307718 [Acyrthosiphon pisum]|eukprot:XP_008178182.1 PREDICTED: uncharacterized protein LOC103307718 [Acyrthosiphon pisum]
MPRSRRGIKRKLPNQTDLECTVNEVQGNSLTVSEASLNKDTYNYTSNINHRRVFTVDEEKELVEYLKMSARLQYSLTKTDTRKLANQFAVSNGKHVKEWDKSEEAGKEWMRGFFSRNNTLSLRKTEPTRNSTVHVPPKIIATKGSKQVGCMTSGERGINVTMICAINAAGNHVPPIKN